MVRDEAVDGVYSSECGGGGARALVLFGASHLLRIAREIAGCGVSILR